MVLLDLLGGLRRFLRVRNGSDVDSPVFKLHYSITSTVLVGFSLLVTTATLVGEPINCLHGKDSRLNDKAVNTYCWIHTTFTLPNYLHRTREIGYTHPHPGIGTADETENPTFHAYYQWVPFVLFLEAVLFYVPHWIWKAWEGRKINSLTSALQNPVLSQADQHSKVDILAEYLQLSIHTHNIYAIKFVICECLNFFNCLFNIWILDKFLGGTFSSVGLDSLRYTEANQDTRTDPLIVAFPRITKCTFHLYGPSGSIEKMDLMCVLAVNNINEKIFIFLWFWLVLLSLISGFSLLYRVIVLSTPILRIAVLKNKVKFRHKNVAKLLRKKLQMGDFFVFNLISKNVDMPTFSMLIHNVYHRLESISSVNLEMTVSPKEETKLLCSCSK